ncbi:MAG: FGGY-family carbohydrate kinase [Actinobacteria bacterium]|nr:FGGY-family carbohydrate kinase [Actinomycetota bacterium]
MSSPLLLGLDIGTGSSKAVLAEPSGTVVAVARQPHRTSYPRPGWAEHDVEAVWWSDFKALCARLVTESRRSRIAAICVSGIGPCLAPCDAELRALRPAILYGVDSRASVEIEEIERRLGREEIFRRGGSVLSSQALGPKLLWLREHEPEVWARCAGWYMASSYVVARLTGEYVLDHHSASQCDPFYDLQARGWAEDWAAELIPGVPLPRLVWPTDVVGEVGAEAAAECGLAVGTPVLGGTVDALAEAFSVGVRRPGDAMLMYGSTTFFIAVADAPVTDPGLWATEGVEPAVRCLAAGTATAGSLIDWVADLTGEPVAELLAAAATVPAAADGLLMLPYLAGERTPIFDPDARGVLAGLTLSHGRGHLARAAIEAIAFGIRHLFEEVRAADARVDRLVAVGGGLADRLWPQIVSDVTGLSQLVPKEAVGAAYGDALLAAIGVGLVDSAADWAEIDDRIDPRPASRDLYDDRYALFRELYVNTAAVNRRLSGR